VDERGRAARHPSAGVVRHADVIAVSLIPRYW